MKKVLFILSLLVMSTVSASEADIKPFIKGSFQQIQQEHKESVFIVTFWSETCAFCMKELAMFGNLIKKYPNVALVSITTDPFLEEETVKQILASKNLQHIEKWVFADNYVERLYFDIDKSWRGELPVTYFFGRDNKMLKHLGIINEQELTEWLSAQ